MEEELIFYFAPFSRALRVEKYLDFTKIPHQKVLVDLTKNEQHSGWYRKINPFGKVPAIKHGEVVIVESAAIIMYLADSFPSKNLAPSIDSIERGLYYQWFMLLMSTLEPALLAMDNVVDTQKAKNEVQELLKVIDSQVTGSYLVGDSLSAVDILFHGELWWIKSIAKLLPDNLTNLRDYYKRISTEIYA